MTITQTSVIRNAARGFKARNGFLIIYFLLSSSLLLNVACSSACGNNLIAQTHQKEGNRELVVFERGCGATTSFVTHVGILDNGHGISDDTVGNIFIADSNRGMISMSVDAKWISPSTILIQYPAGARIFKKLTQINKVSVLYHEN
jgi:hypothetical protein